MSQHASFIPPNIEPPDPPEAKVVALIFSIIMAVIMIAGIGYVCVDFVADMMGQPMFFAAKQPPMEVAEFPKVSVEEIKDPFELVTPRHQTRMRNPKVVIIYTVRLPGCPASPPNLIIDGIQHPWEMQYGNNTWFARHTFEPGEHRVQAAESEAVFLIDPLLGTGIGSARWSPEQWAHISLHPGTNEVDQCGSCHEMRGQPASFSSENRGMTIGQWKGITSCFASGCHKEEDHESIHRVVQPATNMCLRCHSLH